MGSLYDKVDNEAIIARIDALSVDSIALWGKIAADQMCKHCEAAIQVVFGKQDLKINFLMRLLETMLKSKAFNTGFK